MHALLACAVLLFSLPNVVFMTPEGEVRPGQLEGPVPVYKKVTDPALIAQYKKWLDNDSARMALQLYAQAREIAEKRGLTQAQPAEYYIALVPGGNHGAVGFKLKSESGVEEYPRKSYMQLDAAEGRFRTTLLHETGHVVVAMLAGGRMLPQRSIASLPHTTAALTDRGTAFDEGFGIHLETLAAHRAQDAELRNAYYHQQFLFGDYSTSKSEYHRHAADLLSFSQSIARYAEVRDNWFAFDSAWTGPDYLRVQLEKARDFSALRNPDQLLQSEGFYATFFFSLLMRGTPPSDEVLQERQGHVLNALAEMFATKPFDAGEPWMLDFVATYAKLYPDEAAAVNNVLLDLSRGVFVDPQAAEMWHKHYLAALALDLNGTNIKGITEARKKWREQVLKDPAILYSRIGPEVPCSVKGPTVTLVAFGKPEPLAFDVNTAQAGIMRMVPGITEKETASWLAARDAKPFASPDDFKKRSGLTAATLESMEFPSQSK